jgi:hypothetical protein
MEVQFYFLQLNIILVQHCSEQGEARVL